MFSSPTSSITSCAMLREFSMLGRRCKLTKNFLDSAVARKTFTRSTLLSECDCARPASRPSASCSQILPSSRSSNVHFTNSFASGSIWHTLPGIHSLAPHSSTEDSIFFKGSSRRSRKFATPRAGYSTLTSTLVLTGYYTPALKHFSDVLNIRFPGRRVASLEPYDKARFWHAYFTHEPKPDEDDEGMLYCARSVPAGSTRGARAATESAPPSSSPRKAISVTDHSYLNDRTQCFLNTGSWIDKTRCHRRRRFSGKRGGRTSSKGFLRRAGSSLSKFHSVFAKVAWDLTSLSRFKLR
jgi:hypothetical protein